MIRSRLGGRQDHTMAMETEGQLKKEQWERTANSGLHPYGSGILTQGGGWAILPGMKVQIVCRFRRFAPLLAMFLVLLGNTQVASAEKNLLPRLPEFVIERGFSDAFQVVESTARATLFNDTAESRVSVVLKNVSDRHVDSSIKVRILYLESDQSVGLSVNGHGMKFDRKNPRVPLSLNPGEQVTLEIKARQGIQYNLDALKKEQRAPSGEKESGKKPKFALDDLSKLFGGRENFGRRFLVGPLVSKWGIFPVEFKQVKVEISVPSDFDAVFPREGAWSRKSGSNGHVYSFEGETGFNGVVFLPKADVAEFRKVWQSPEASPSAAASATPSPEK